MIRSLHPGCRDANDLIISCGSASIHAVGGVTAYISPACSACQCQLRVLRRWICVVLQNRPVPCGGDPHPSKSATPTSAHVLLQRSAFGRIGGAVARQWGDRGFAGSLDFVLRGSGGQSFGCFMARPPPPAPPRPALTQACTIYLASEGRSLSPSRFDGFKAMLMFVSQGQCRWRAST